MTDCQLAYLYRIALAVMKASKDVYSRASEPEVNMNNKGKKDQKKEEKIEENQEE